MTASGIVVGRRGTVLHRHKKLGIWMQPGGHIDAGESPEEAALREATEELGLAVEHPPAGPLLLHSTCTRPRTGTRISTCATCCWAPTPTRSRHPTRAPMPAGAAGRRPMQMADPALIDALPLARTAYEAMA